MLECVNGYQMDGAVEIVIVQLEKLLKLIRKDTVCITILLLQGVWKDKHKASYYNLFLGINMKAEFLFGHVKVAYEGQMYILERAWVNKYEKTNSVSHNFYQLNKFGFSTLWKNWF